MSSDAEILAPRAGLSQAGPDSRRWAALVVMLLAGLMNRVGAFVLAFLLMLALPRRRRHTDEAPLVKEINRRARGIPARDTATEEYR